MTNATAQFRTGYMDDAVFSLDMIVREATKILKPHSDEFDTLVGTGLSGGLVVPMLATRLRKSFVIVRKETDDSHHGGGRLVGRLGERWIFVDDFVSSGKTRDRVASKITLGAALEDHRTEWVGSYYYGRHINQKYQTTHPNRGL